jgi:hypothetical protein
VTPFAAVSDIDLTGDSDASSAATSESKPDADGEVPFDEKQAGRPDDSPFEAVVSTRSHCEGCEHLSAPPQFRCTLDGTRIIAFEDRTHVRVRGCPVAATDAASE